MQGTDLTRIRQQLLQHTFLPLISVQSTRQADLHLQNACDDPLLSSLTLLRPYGNNARFPVPNQSYRICNVLLISRTYSLFPIRIEAPIPESSNFRSSGRAEQPIQPLFSISSLEYLLQHAQQVSSSEGDETVQNPPVKRLSPDLYLDFFQKVITSNQMVLFETFNHPVAHILVALYPEDTIDSIRRMVADFRNYPFPKYFQLSDILTHVFILYDSNRFGVPELTLFVKSLDKLAITSSAIPLLTETGPDKEIVRLPRFSGLTIEEQSQLVSLQSSVQEPHYISVPKSLDTTIRVKMYEFIAKLLIPHMERLIRVWDDQVLGPKKSFTGRFFSASRKLFTGADAGAVGATHPHYNHSEHFYPRSSPEQMSRKLGDWALMLKDFKYAYAAYDLIKKDYTNDKAWVYVAAAQELCMVSLLLAQTQPLTTESLPVAPDKNTLRKIKHDIIEPYMDNLAYTFKLRFNVKTYSMRSHLVVAELLLHMSTMFNLPWWWGSLIENYFLNVLVDMRTSTEPQVWRALLFERIGYCHGRSFFVEGDYVETVECMLSEFKQRNVLQMENQSEGENPQTEPLKEGESEGFYVNSAKMHPSTIEALSGKTRLRKAALYYIIAMLEWVKLGNKRQAKRLKENIFFRYTDWYPREDLALAPILRFIGEPMVTSTTPK